MRSTAKTTVAPGMVALLLLASACDGSDDEMSESAPATSPETQSEAVRSATQLPDTTGDAVWEMLTAERFQDNWTLWPGMGELYTGNEPHGMLLTTYLNDVALEALESRAGSMPIGAVLVKENYMPDSTLAATTVMVKRDVAYNPEHNGWWWLKRLADGTNEVEGRGAGCQSCHGGQAADNDYVVTGPLSGVGR